MKFPKIFLPLIIIAKASHQYMLRKTEEHNLGYACWHQEDGVLYKVADVAHESLKPYHIPKARLDIGTEDTPNIVTGDIYVNFCEGVSGSKVKNCDKDLTSAGFFVYNNGESCLSLSTHRKKRTGDKIDPIHTKWTYDIIKETGGLIIKGNNSEILDNTVTKKEVHLKFVCVEKILNPTNDNVNSDYNEGILTISVDSRYGCGQEILGPLGKLIKLKWPLAMIGIIFGLLLIPYGAKIFKISISALAFIIVFLFMYAFFQLAWAKMNPTVKFWVILGFSIVLSLIGAYFIFTNEKTAFVISGIFLGCIVGMMLYTSLGLYKFEKDGQNLILWLTVLGCGLISGGCGYYLHNHAIIFATAFGGAYLLMRSIGSLIGNYPNEFDIADQIRKKKIERLPTAFWIYLVFIIIFGVAGVIFQYKNKDDELEVEGLSDDEYESFNAKE